VLIDKQMLCLIRRKVLLENQLEMEKIKVETGKKKISLLQDQVREKVSSCCAAVR
jgi:hypothetical protein